MKAEKGAHCVIWSPNLGKESGEEEGKTVPPQSLWRPCGDPGGRGRGPARQKVGLPWAESLLGEASG